MIFMLEGKVVLVTGASRGIGRATALMAAQNHAKVIVNYNNSEDKAAELVDMIREQGYEATMIKADVSNEDEVKQMFKQIKKDYSRIDVLVNNAGIMKDSLLMFTKAELFDEIINTNCKGTFLCSRYASKMMIKQKSGKIINLSSIIGTQGSKGQSIYSGSKAFIVGFTKSLAKELGSYNIKVNAVAPGSIETDMLKIYDDEILENLKSNISLERLGKPEDVANVIIFLSSDMGNYVSGQVIGVDGCQTL
jgi:3-oxoacyl-[acyl-carrier protein] reductase